MKIPTGLYVNGFSVYMYIETNQTMQINDSLVLCWHCWCGLGWQLIGGVNISDACPEYLQPERMISGSCNVWNCVTQCMTLHTCSCSGTGM